MEHTQKKLKVDTSKDESEEDEWDDIIPNETAAPEYNAPDPQVKNIEIVIENKLPSKTGIKKRDRILRRNIHHVHLLCLLSSVIHRNHWINQPSTLANLLSLIPKSFSIINKSNIKKFAIWFHHYVISEKFDWDPFGEVELLFVGALRAANVQTRLIASLYPISLSLAKSTPNCPVIYWGEVFLDYEWIAISSEGNLGPDHFVNSSNSYIIALDTEFGIKDITKKYSHQWGAITSKLRSEEWWNSTLWLYSKSHSTAGDMLDDLEMQRNEANEKMPSNLKGFLNHPLYALQRHCKKNEVIYPDGKKHAVGMFKKIAWKKEGRQVKEGEEPFRITKEDSVSAQLYGEWQTEVLSRPILQNMALPSNKYGNFELFHPNMLPVGCVHLSGPYYKRIAKSLGISFKEVVTGFEFRNRRMVPVVDGVLVFEQDAPVLKDSVQEFIVQERQKILKQKEKTIWERWRRLIMKLLLQKRLEKEYL
ncbi:hypothetical protein HK103_002134 [Boothiomyces macroporosus]|uniref:Uncharacterized protein n=1 Tax=Boothiomyces macroporosus TaxID=261099 RepID=A0AAD5UJ99_9FUNG|nr:hypothetical protein HK103_002134 [Boothiomyces macroporosus]